MSFQGKIFIFIALVLKKGILYKKIQLTYPQRELEGSLLEQRPDLYLGRFLSMFADIVFGQYANLDDTDGRYQFHQHVYWQLLQVQITSCLNYVLPTVTLLPTPL